MKSGATDNITLLWVCGVSTGAMRYPRRGRDRVATATEDQQRPAEVLDELDAGAGAKRLRPMHSERCLSGLKTLDSLPCFRI